MCAQSDGNVCSTVCGRDMGSHSARPQTTACLSNEMLVGHPLCDGMTLWHKMRNEDIFADTGEVLVEA